MTETEKQIWIATFAATMGSSNPPSVAVWRAEEAITHINASPGTIMHTVIQNERRAKVLAAIGLSGV